MKPPKMFLAILILHLISSCQASDTVANGPTFAATKCIDESIIDIMDTNYIPGASFAVLRRGQLAYEQGYGTRDAPGVGDEDGRPASPSTPFRVASISKSVTALVVLVLAQRGRLRLDDAVFGDGGALDRYAGGGSGPADPRVLDVTVRHLLRHSAGFAPVLVPDDPLTDPMLSSALVSSALGIPGPASCDDTIRFMMNVTLLYAPGSGVAYSNFGYCVLGRVIEAVTGTTYLTAARSLLLDPSGVDPDEMYLGRTRLGDIPPEEAEYHTSLPGCFGPSLFPGDGMNVSCPYGSLIALESADSLGAWVASARQLVKVVAATSPPHCEGGGCLLDEKWRDELEELPPFYPTNSTTWYGLGWVLSVVDEEDGLSWMHPGGLPGTVSFLVRMDEDDGYAYALIFNGDNFTEVHVLISEIAKCVDDDNWPVKYYASTSSPTAVPTSSPTVMLTSSPTVMPTKDSGAPAKVILPTVFFFLSLVAFIVL